MKQPTPPEFSVHQVITEGQIVSLGKKFSTYQLGLWEVTLKIDKGAVSVVHRLTKLLS